MTWLLRKLRMSKNALDGIKVISFILASCLIMYLMALPFQRDYEKRKLLVWQHINYIRTHCPVDDESHYPTGEIVITYNCDGAKYIFSNMLMTDPRSIFNHGESSEIRSHYVPIIRSGDE